MATDGYRRIPGYPGYDCNADVTDVRSYWIPGRNGGYTVSEPQRSMKPHRKGASISYFLKYGDKRRWVRRATIQMLAWSTSTPPNSAMTLDEFKNTYVKDAAAKAAKKERSDIHMMADTLAHNIPGMGVVSALELLAVIGAIMPENKPELESIKWELGL